MIESTSRVGRSEGATIFWGLISVFFAAAACFYFWKSQKNESYANKLHDEVLTLQDDRDTLNAEKEKLQASMSDSAGQLKTREEFLDEKEAKLAAEETRLESMGLKPSATSTPAPASAPSTAVPPKKFTDTIHKLSQTNGADVVTRGGRQILRIPNASFFAPGNAALKPDGKAVLNQIAQSLSAQADDFELRVESYTDTDMESSTADAASKSHYATSWDLTAARAAAIARYYRDQTDLPFQNVLVIARGDSQPIATGAKDHARNQRLEISVAPLPAAFHSNDSDSDSSKNSLAPPPDTPAPANKAK